VADDVVRRRAPRVRLALEGSLSGRRNVRWDVGVLDLSLSGCLVRCPGNLGAGEILDLRLPLGGEEVVVAKVQVADSSVDGTSPDASGFLVGLRFFGLQVEDERRLRAFLEGERRRASASA
jgi:hypothetical protein